MRNNTPRITKNLLAKSILQNSIPPYIFMVFAILTTFAIRFIADPIIFQNAPLAIFLLPVVLSAAYGGLRYGVIAMVLGLVLSYYFFMDPKYEFGFKGITNVYRIIVYLGTGFLLSLLGKSRLFYKNQYSVLLKAERKARIKAEKAVKDRELFISVASHELKTPLTSIKLFIQLLQKNPTITSNREQVLYLESLNEQTNKLTNLVSQLLDISKIQTGKLPLVKESFDIKSVIQDAIQVVSNTDDRHTIVFSGNSKKTIYGDKDKITQVVTNLLSNAAKYSPSGKKIVVKLFTDKQHATVSVRDFGIGIDEKHQRKIFHRFYRVYNSKKNTISGLGIGLYISAEIIKSHGGKIWVKSEKAKGSTFSFSLPCT